MAKWKFKKKKRRPSPLQKAKKETDRWCSRYVRIKAAVDFCKSHANYPNDLVGECYTCDRIVDVVHKGDSGHYKSRGMGGSSGLYFNVKAIRLQCKRCNGFEGGMPKEFREHLVREYGESQVKELELRHRIHTYTMFDIVGLGLYFKEEVEKMCKKHGIRKWW